MHHQYAPLGHFQSWAKLSFPEFTTMCRLMFLTLVWMSDKHVFLHNGHTGVLMQAINLDDQVHLGGGVWYVDMNQRHAFVCALHVLCACTQDRDATKVLEVLQTWLIYNISP